MEFGLGKYLEMFEDRFGRRATTALITILSLALLSVCIKTIYYDLFLHLYHAIQSITGDHSLYQLLKEQAVSFIFSGVASIIGLLLFQEVITAWSSRRIEKIRQRAINDIDGVQAQANKLFDLVEEQAKELNKIKALVDKIESQDR